MKRWWIGIGDVWIPTPLFGKEESCEEKNYIEYKEVNYPRCEGIPPNELFRLIDNVDIKPP